VRDEKVSMPEKRITTQPPAAGGLYGEPGVLTFDPLLDRIQCAVCGRWYKAIMGSHLHKHGMTCEEYKEQAGLNIGTSLTTPSVQELKRRRSLAANSGRYLKKRCKGDAATLGEPGRHQHRPEYRRRRAQPEARQHQALALRKWTDDEMLTALRARRALPTTQSARVDGGGDTGIAACAAAGAWRYPDARAVTAAAVDCTGQDGPIPHLQVRVQAVWLLGSRGTAAGR